MGEGTQGEVGCLPDIIMKGRGREGDPSIRWLQFSASAQVVGTSTGALLYTLTPEVCARLQTHTHTSARARTHTHTRARARTWEDTHTWQYNTVGKLTRGKSWQALALEKRTDGRLAFGKMALSAN